MYVRMRDQIYSLTLYVQAFVQAFVHVVARAVAHVVSYAVASVIRFFNPPALGPAIPPGRIAIGAGGLRPVGSKGRWPRGPWWCHAAA